jgi:hypothetical protein
VALYSEPKMDHFVMAITSTEARSFIGDARFSRRIPPIILVATDEHTSRRAPWANETADHRTWTAIASRCPLRSPIVLRTRLFFADRIAGEFDRPFVPRSV